MVINDEDIEIIEEEPEEEGGKRYNCQEVFPLKPEGKLESFEYYYGDSPWGYRFTFKEGKIAADLSMKRGYNAYRYQGELNKTQSEKLEELAKKAALLNGWCVETNGLPVCGESYCSIDFSDGSHAYFSFNGGDCPPGFDALNEELLEYVKEVSGYSEDKLVKYVPPVNPYLGTHIFEDEKDGKKETYILTLHDRQGNDNCELNAEGTLGNIHMKCKHSRVHGSRLGDYFIEMTDYFEDSKEKEPYKQGHLMATMKCVNGVMYLYPCYGLSFEEDKKIERKEFKEL